MPLNIELQDADGYIDGEGHLIYPKLSPTLLQNLKRDLSWDHLWDEPTAKVLTGHSPAEYDPMSSDDLGCREIALMIAKLKQAKLPYTEILAALIPDYRKKIATLCGKKGELDFIPSTHPTIGKDWSAISKIIFKSSEDLSTEDLIGRMYKAHVHGLQYLPPYVNELGLLQRDLGARLPLPVFTPIHQTESAAPSLMWHMAGDWNYLMNQNELWSQGIAPAGTHFVGVCEQEFFTKAMKAPSLSPDSEPEL